MKSALMAVAITALMGGLVVGPVTQQSAEAQVYSGLKTLSSTSGTPTSGTPTTATTSFWLAVAPTRAISRRRLPLCRPG